MMRRLGLVLGLVLGLASSAQAQTCNPASGFLTSNGPYTVGDAIVFGPNCGQVQDAANAGGIPLQLPFNIRSTFGNIVNWGGGAGNAAMQWQNLVPNTTISLALNPGPSPPAVGTISEIIFEQTNLQNFGGSYGRWSASNPGGGVWGLIGEFGGTFATNSMGPFLIQNGVENPPSTFTVQNFMRGFTISQGDEASQAGAVSFGVGDSTPINKVVLSIAPPLANSATTNSHALLLQGTYRNNVGNAGSTMWRMFNNILSFSTGASQLLWQSNPNGTPGGWVTQGFLTDTGVFSPRVGFQLNQAAATAGHYLRGNGTNYIDGTIAAGDLPTIPVNGGGTNLTSTTINQILYSSANNVIAGLATANNGVLVTSAGGVPSIGSTLPNAVQDNITRLANNVQVDLAQTNQVQLSGGASGANTVGVSAVGGDANINLFLNAKGTGFVQLGLAFRSAGVAGLLNGFIAVPATAGGSPSMQCNDTGGTGDSNINCVFIPKGTGFVDVTNDVKTGAVIVANLPTCNAGRKGARYFVTDANATTFHNTVAGGGANNVGVTCDGTNWYIS